MANELQHQNTNFTTPSPANLGEVPAIRAEGGQIYDEAAGRYNEEEAKDETVRGLTHRLAEETVLGAGPTSDEEPIPVGEIHTVPKNLVDELLDEPGERLPDQVILPTFRVNGLWPQIDGPEVLTMGAEVSKLVNAGGTSWEGFYNSRGLTKTQFTAIGRMINGYHERYGIPKKYTEEAPRTLDFKKILPQRLYGLVGGWRSNVEAASKTFTTTANSYPQPWLRRIASKTSSDPTVQRASLNQLWQVAAAELADPKIEEMSNTYRDRLSRLYQTPKSEQRAAAVKALKKEVGTALYDTILDKTLGARKEIARSTGYVPPKPAVEAWLQKLFPLRNDSRQV